MKSISFAMKKVSVNDGLLPPYRYSRKRFTFLLNEFAPRGACSSERYNGKIDWRGVSNELRIKYMSYGVPQWLHQKALDGCTESLWKLQYHYDLYDEVKTKRKEELQLKRSK